MMHQREKLINTKIGTHKTNPFAVCLTAFLAMFFITSRLAGQGNPCAEALHQGVYDHYKQSNSVQRHHSMRDYFKSDDFEQDIKKGGWGGGISFPIYGVPVGINASSSKEDFRKFRQQIEKVTDSQLDEVLANEVEKSAPNTDFTKQYFDCVARTYGKGFSWTSEQVGKRAFITIRFQPISASNPMPVVQNVTIDNAEKVLAPREGQQLDFSTFVSGLPIDTKEPMVVTLTTNQGTMYAWSTPTATPPPTTKAQKTINVPANSFVRGTDVKLGGPNNMYGAEVLLNGPDYQPRPNAAEFDFKVEGSGHYRLYAMYAAAQERPVRILINNKIALTNALGATTGGWGLENQKEMDQGIVELKEGWVVMRVERNNMFPHIKSFRFEPAD